MKKVLFSTLVCLSITSNVSSQVSKEDSLHVQKAFETLSKQSSAKVLQMLQKRYYDDSVKYYRLDISTLNDYIFKEVNEQRRLIGVGLLTKKSDAVLQKDCDDYASYLVTNDLIGHDANATYSAEIVVASTATMDNALRNDDQTAVYTVIAKSLVNCWLNSPKHKSSMLSGEYKQCIVSTSKKYYYTKNVWSSSGQVMDLRDIGFNLRGIVRFYK